MLYAAQKLLEKVYLAGRKVLIVWLVFENLQNKNMICILRAPVKNSFCACLLHFQESWLVKETKYDDKSLDNRLEKLPELD